MSSGQCAYRDCGANLQSSRTLVAAIAVVMTIAAFSWAPDADGKRKSRNKDREPAAQATQSADVKVAEGRPQERRGRMKKHAGRRLDQTALRCLPDDCRAFGWIKVAPMLESEMGRKLTVGSPDFWNDCGERVAPLELKTEQIDRIVFGARSLTEGEASKAVMILFCKQPVQQSGKDVAADGTSWTSETIGPWTVWVRGGEKPWAVCTVEDRVVLAGYPDPVRAVLRRDGPCDLPEQIDRARRLLDPSAAMAMTFLPPADFVQPNSLPLPIAHDLVGKIDAFNLELEFDADLALRMSAVCRDEAAAQQLNGIGTGLLALVQMQSLEDQQPGVRNMIRSVAFEIEGPVLTASMNVPSELVQVAESDSKCKGGSTWQLGPATSNLTATPPPGPLAAVYPVVPPNAPATPSPYAAPPSCPPCLPAIPTPHIAPPSYQPCVPATPTPYAVPPSYAPPSTSPPAYTNPKAVPPPVPWGQPISTLPTLQIADVIRLVEAGVDDEIIIRHIQKHRLAADLTADDLIQLTKSEASTQVITTLQQIPVASKAGQPGTNKAKWVPYRPGAQTRASIPEPAVIFPQCTDSAEQSWLRQLLEEWERIWFLDQPDHATPVRTHGGII